MRAHITRTIAFVLLFIGGGLPALAQGADAQAAKDVVDAQSARYHASIGRDLAALDRLIADDMAYGHSNGGVDSKTWYLKAVEGGRYKNFVPRGMNAQVYGGAAVVTGQLTVTAAAGAQDASVTFRIIDVYVKRGGRWQLVHTQSTRIEPQPH